MRNRVKKIDDDVSLDDTENRANGNKEKIFKEAFKGKFFGVLRWHQLDELWLVLKNKKNEGWYVYAVGEEPPVEKIEASELEMFIDKMDMLLRREHGEDYCGIVYADNIQNPSFIKVFDPNNIGTSCSVGQDAPLPGWIISKIPPINLPEAMKPTANRRRWWQKIFK